MFDEEKTMIGRGRDANDMIVDENSFSEGRDGKFSIDPK